MLVTVVQNSQKMGISKEFEEILQFWKKYISTILTSSSICSHFMQSSSKSGFSAISAIFHFLFLCQVQSLAQYFPKKPRTTKILRRLSSELQQLQRKSSPSHAALRRSIKWNRVCIFAWISFFCVCSNADQGKSIFSFPQFVVGLMSIARSTSLVLDNVLVFQSFAISLKPAR